MPARKLPSKKNLFTDADLATMSTADILARLSDDGRAHVAAMTTQIKRPIARSQREFRLRVPPLWPVMRLWLSLPVLRDLTILYKGHTFWEWSMYEELERERARGRDFRRMNRIRIKYGWNCLSDPAPSSVPTARRPRRT